MPDNDALLPQFGGNPGRVVLRVTGEDEVGGRRQHLESLALQLLDQRLTAVDHLLAGALEVLAIFESGRRADNRQAIQRVGVEAVLDPLQRFDQIRMSNGEAHPQPRQRTRLGQGLRDEQVRITLHQTDGGFATEIDIGLIDHND